ncbi:uncharacterized protein LAJ45_00099 [Morchella importuna]|uniref:uncharacterized protein n=1 Tax=Morchella importuna TaxID=1174673 RepID=UPI001E8CB457|nr:uncharacterized protein LAJ45_00099 [Morchella importuna]KAH8155090.1 hypothetical protein LAJ45_00099 [Morchella importuna]
MGVDEGLVLGLPQYGVIIDVVVVISVSHRRPLCHLTTVVLRCHEVIRLGQQLTSVLPAISLIVWIIITPPIASKTRQARRNSTTPPLE